MSGCNGSLAVVQSDITPTAGFECIAAIRGHTENPRPGPVL
jgi:hypothetical protein